MFYKIWWLLRALLYKPFFGKFGLHSYIGAPVFLLGIKNIFIYKNVRIYPQIRLEAHNAGKITIMEDVSIGQNVHITSAGNLIIGRASTILANVFITNIDHDFEEIGIHILKQRHIVRDTRIGENAFIGIGAAIQAGTVLGKQCIVGANAVVRGHFPDYCVIVGAPARIVRRYNEITRTWDKTYPDGSFK